MAHNVRSSWQSVIFLLITADGALFVEKLVCLGMQFAKEMVSQRSTGL